MGISLTPFLDGLVGKQIPSGLNIYVIYYIYLAQSVISYFSFAYKSVILTASQRQDIESKILLGVNSAAYILQISLLLIFRDYYLFLIVLPPITVAINLLRGWITTSRFPAFRAEGMISPLEKREIFGRIWPLIGHRLSGVIISGSANVVISVYLGISMVALYNNYLSVTAAFAGIVIAGYSAIQPGIGNSMATEKPEKNYNDFKKVSFLVCWLVGWVSVVLVCTFEDFIELAYGAGFPLGIKTVLLLVSQFYIWKTSDIVMTYRDVVGKWNGDTFVPYIASILNLVGSIVLVGFIGLDGVILSTTLVLVFVSLPASVTVLYRHAFQKPPLTYLRGYFRNTIGVVLVGLVTYWLCSLLNSQLAWINLVLKGVVAVVVSGGLFVLIFWRTAELKEWAITARNWWRVRAR